MTEARRRLLRTLLVSGTFLLGAGDLAAQDGTGSSRLRWGVAPPLLPPGALIAVVSGDPAGPGQATIELSMPDGYRMPPHFHPTDERVEVKQGTTVVSVTFVGPYTITYVHAHEAPRQGAFPFGY